MNILHPHGMIERLGESHRYAGFPARYGRKKQGSPKNARSMQIADENDRRRQPREDDDPLRGRLIDLNA